MASSGTGSVSFLVITNGSAEGGGWDGCLGFSLQAKTGFLKPGLNDLNSQALAHTAVANITLVAPAVLD